MSKGAKRVKSGTAQAVGVAKWETGLVAAPFEEDDWKASITFVVGNRPEDYEYINILSSVIANGTRKLFSVISKEELYPQVKELGNPKSKKPKEVPAFYEVCEPCKNYVDTGEDIPTSLLSKLLKFKLLAIKAADIKRRETEKKGGGDKDKGKKDKGRDRSKSPSKKGGKKTPEPPSAKEGSKLKKRGEDDQENKYIDDEPDDGPQHYIIIQGFNNPQLLSLLAELGINVNAIIKIRTQDYNRFDKTDEEETAEKEKDDKTLAAEEAAKQEKTEIKKDLNKFWKEILPLLQNQPQLSKLHDVARLEYEIKNILIPQNLEDNEQKTNFGSAMFEDIACMIYDLLDAKRLYYSYIENLKLLHVPLYGSSFPPADGASAVSAPTPAQPAPPAGSALSLAPVDGVIEGHVQADMRYYNDLMNCIPQESVSVPLILHCMLEQVVSSEEQRDPPSEIPPPPRSDGLNNDLASFINGMTFKLALTEEEHKQLTNSFDIPERLPDMPKQPLLMNHQDDMTHRLYHLKTINGFDPIEVEKEMLKKLPLNRYIDIPRVGTSVSRDRASRLQELIHFCATGGLSQSEIDRAFKQFVFECIDLSATDPNGFILTRLGEGIEHSAIPWDDPYPYFKGMIPKQERSAAPNVDLDDTQSGTNDVLKHTPALTDERVSRTPPPVHFDTTPEIFEDDATDKVAKSKQKDKLKNSGIPSPILRDSRSPALHERSASASMASSQGSSPDRSRPSTADSKKGILRQSRSNSPVKHSRSRSNSVHFEKITDGIAPGDDADGENMDKEENEQEMSTEDNMNEVVDAQKRVLDQWCFAEHFEPNVLLQVLQESSYNLPFMDTYYHKRDHSLMVVFHNPYNTELLNHVDWHEELHSNLGFRNYLENVAESISDWLKEEDAKYQAHYLAQELEKMRQAEEAQAKSQEKSSKGRSKSPKKSPSRSKSPKSGSRAGSSERPSSASSNPFVRSGSLKAWKEEQDRLKEEEEEKERLKSAKRTKSPKKQEKEDKDKDKKGGSRNSAKSKASHPVVEAEPTSEEIQPAEPEQYWPFTGYDVGNDLLHVSGIVTSLFPSDGGQIRTERTEFIQSTTAVKTSVMKDGHVFTIHVLNPKEPTDDTELSVTEESIAQSDKEALDESMRESQDLNETKVSKQAEGKPSVSGFGSITGLFSDGMTLAFSQFGSSGSVEKEKSVEPECDLSQPASPVPQQQQQQQQTSPRKDKKGEKGKEKAPPTPEPSQPPPEDEQLVEEKVVESFVDQPFQQLFVTCPDGLNISYYLESSIGVKPITDDDRRILVKQSYPFKTKGEQDCESMRKKFALSEQSRVTTSDGTVIKNMMDGTIQVLHADGTVAVHSGPWPLNLSRSSSPNRLGTPKSATVGTESPLRKGRPGKPGGKNVSLEKEQPSEETGKSGTWTITYPQGERFSFTSDGVEDLKPVMTSLASDPETRQSMSTRDDHVITVSYPDGTTIVEHADGTRMTTYYRDTQVPVEGDDSLETGEEPRYERETIKFVKVECPGYATLEFNCLSSENLTIFGNATTINVFPDGYYMLHHNNGGRMEIDTEGTMIYFPRQNKSMEQILPDRAVQYVLRHNADIVCETVDPDGNVFNVKYNGDYTVQMANEEEASSVLSGDSQLKQEKKIISYKQHSPRFFVIHRNGSGTELLRYQDVAEYLMTAEQSPATAVLRDSLADCPGVTGITILKPYIGGPSERWLKKYDLESIIPTGIRSRDLTNVPSREYKKPGPGFGTTLGQGLSVGGAIKSPVRIPILKCPDLLELRQIVQYRPISSDLRDSLNDGLREYAEYVKSRSAASDLMQVTDPRSDEEKRQAVLLQNLAFLQQELEPADIKEKYESATAAPAPTPPPTPQPKRTTADWERDRRELDEEREARDALRNKTIPKYFDSEFGKAFLLTQAKDMDEMMKHISEDPRQDGSAAVRADSSTPGYPHESGSSSSNHADAGKLDNGPVATSATSERTLTSTETPSFNQATKVVSETPVSNYAGFISEATPSGVRPGNPTPAHATGHGSPAPVRPKNPTPAHAMKSVPERPGNPTPKQASAPTDNLSDQPSKEIVDIVNQPIVEEVDYGGEMMNGDSELILTRSLKVNVLGEPRRDEVSLPSSIKGGRPGAFPNSRFQQVEDPVRRKVNNTIVTGATLQGQTQIMNMRGLMLYPEEVEFGVLKEGHTYAFNVNLKNTGVDSCRYKIRQPPPATGLRVYYQPGPVAAGMKAELVLELYAIAVGVEGDAGIGSVRHDIEIITETDILYLPVSAVVLTAHEYDNRNSTSPQGKKSAGVRIVSKKPPASSGIIRPRREPTTGSSVIKVQ